MKALIIIGMILGGLGTAGELLMRLTGAPGFNTVFFLFWAGIFIWSAHAFTRDTE